MSDLMLAYNPRRRRRSRRGFRRSRRYARIRRNPRNLGSMTGGAPNLIGNIVPIGAGFALGLTVPKMLNLEGAFKWIAPIAGGVLAPIVLSGFLGRKTATQFGLAMAASAVVYAVDEMFFKKQGTPILADNVGQDVELISAEDEQMQIPEISAEPEYIGADAEYVGEGEQDEIM